MPSNQYNSSYTGVNHDTYVTKEQLIDLVYPVGSYYMSENSVNPTVFFGGSWEQIKDRFILAAGDSYAAGATGGSASHSHTTNAGTTGGTAITVAQMPSHNHSITFKTYGYGGWPTQSITSYIIPYNVGANSNAGTSTLNVANTGFQASIGNNGSGQAHTHSQTSVGTSSVSNMPPYLVAYVWKRVA